MLQKVHRTTLAGKVAQELEKEILEGAWPEGTKIPPEPELAEMLGVGRNTVREAISALTHLGLLEARPGDGTYVRSRSVLAGSLAHRLENCSLQDTLEARDCLEGQAVRLAAKRRTDEDLAALRKGYAELIDDELLSDIELLAQKAWEQDLRLVRASGNPLLLELFETIAVPVQEATRVVIQTALDSDIDPEEPRRLHRELLDAIEAGDPDAADRILAEKARLVRSWLPEEEPHP
jgi:DNA-binding FadR family transcriptional regulator